MGTYVTDKHMLITLWWGGATLLFTLVEHNN